MKTIGETTGNGIMKKISANLNDYSFIKDVKKLNNKNLLMSEEIKQKY